GGRSALALVHALAGEVEAGLAVMRPLLGLVGGAGGEVFVPGLAVAMGALHLRRGDPEEAVRWLARDAGAADRGRETGLAGHGRPPLGAALRGLGRDKEAAEVLARAVAAARRLDMPRVLADALEQQAWLAGDDDRAVELHHEALALRAGRGLRTFYP